MITPCPPGRPACLSTTLCDLIMMMQHIGDPINNTGFSPPIWFFSTTSMSLAADASFALLAANACFITSSGPSQAASTLAATNGCSPADETRCSVAYNLCGPTLPFIQLVAQSATMPRSKPMSTAESPKSHRNRFGYPNPATRRSLSSRWRTFSERLQTPASRPQEVILPLILAFSTVEHPPIGSRPIPVVLQLAWYRLPFDWLLPSNLPEVSQLGAWRSQRCLPSWAVSALAAGAAGASRSSAVRSLCWPASSHIIATLMRCRHSSPWRLDTSSPDAATRHPSQSLENPHFASSTSRLLQNQRALSSLGSMTFPVTRTLATQAAFTVASCNVTSFTARVCVKIFLRSLGCEPANWTSHRRVLLQRSLTLALSSPPPISAKVCCHGTPLTLLVSLAPSHCSSGTRYTTRALTTLSAIPTTTSSGLSTRSNMIVLASTLP